MLALAALLLPPIAAGLAESPAQAQPPAWARTPAVRPLLLPHAIADDRIVLRGLDATGERPATERVDVAGVAP